MRRRRGHKPRGVDLAVYTADIALRRAVRAWLREHYPDTPPPFGGGWFYVLSDYRCPACATRLMIVSIEGVDVPGLAYCASCNSGQVARK